VQNPQWGKFWLAAVGAYAWEGVNPLPPELWLLPRWSPFHPGKMWCHCRMVYLPMSYIYGGKLTAPLGERARALRRELFPPAAPYERVDWLAHRNTVAAIDLYAPHTWAVDAAMAALVAWERWAPRWLRAPLLRAGMAFALEYCEAEDEATNYVCIGPVNKAVNMLVALHAHGARSGQFARHLARVDDYLWVAEDGMKMQGYNGSQLWDTAFATQGLAASGLAGLPGVRVVRHVLNREPGRRGMPAG
jgi:squalene cyclase